MLKQKLIQKIKEKENKLNVQKNYFYVDKLIQDDKKFMFYFLKLLVHLYKTRKVENMFLV